MRRQPIRAYCSICGGTDPELPPQWLRVSIAVFLVTLLAATIIIGCWIALQNGSLAQAISQLLSNPRLAVGIPWAGGAALAIVLILRGSFGTVEFKILGVEFKGASGPTVMWILCFLAEALVMRVL
jgi:hypothetical protein